MGFLIGIIPLFTLWGCNVKAQTSGQDGTFANVMFFCSYDEMHNFTSENGIDDVYACSDGVGEVKLFLVVPASKEIKLELYPAVTDKYGNVEPNYENPLCEAAVGQPIYFASQPVDGKASVVVVAVDGVGRRSFWNPVISEDGVLGVNEEFGNLVSGKKVAEESSSKVGKVIDYENYGIKFMVKGTKVFMEIYDIDKYHKNKLWTPVKTTLTNGTYEIKNINGDCKDIFIGDIGQNTNPILCILLYNNNVEVMSVQKSIDNAFLMSSGILKGLWDVESFENSGGGAYEYDGKTMYSYITIYGIDSGKHKTEVELFCRGIDSPYVSADGKKILLLEDYTLSYTDGDKEYRGIFSYDTINENESLYNISYNFVQQRNLNEDSFSDVDIKGTFEYANPDFNTVTVNPTSGFDLGVPYGTKIIFNNITNQ